MTIVQMTDAHIPALAEIERLCFNWPWTEQGLAEELDNPNARFLVALDEHACLRGYIGCHFVLDEGYIANVAVHPEARRRGVGGALIRALAAQAIKEGLSFLTLEVRAGNVPAIALYTAQGFVPQGVRKNYYTAPQEDALIMTKQFERQT